MAERLVGVAVSGPTIREIQAMILGAEELGIHAAWMTTGGARPDSITAFAATAALTERIKLGTSIVPTYPRHPLVMVQQAQIVATLGARAGSGWVWARATVQTIEAMGIEFNAPLGHLREYLQILKAILQQGRVDFDGEHYTAHDGIPEPLDVEIMGSALRKGSFELCGAESDGAISWICPFDYLRDVALPAMQAGSAAGRTGDAAAHRPRAGLRPRRRRRGAFSGASAGDEPAAAVLPADAGGRRLPGGDGGHLERRDDRWRGDLGRRGEVRRRCAAPVRPGRNGGAGLAHQRRPGRGSVGGPHDADAGPSGRRARVGRPFTTGVIVGAHGVAPLIRFVLRSDTSRGTAHYAMNVAVDAASNVVDRWVCYGLQTSDLARPKPRFKLAGYVSELAYESIDSDFVETRFRRITLADCESFAGEQP